MKITSPGIYDDIPHEDYHADPVPGGSLSSTWARWMTDDEMCPAKVRWQIDHPAAREVTEDMEIGQAYHTKVFGQGPEIVAVEADDWRTRAAQEIRKAARAEGKTPLLARTLAEVDEMVSVLRADPHAAAIFSEGKAEQSFFWQDRHDIWCRGRVDWLPTPREGRRLIVPDLKSAKCAAPKVFGSAVMDRGYAQQADWYLRGLRALGIADESSIFVAIVQEKDPPYIVQPIQFTEDDMAVGRILNDRALDLYAECKASGKWPRYADGFALASMPSWYILPILESE